jgi:hypothetical protein
VTGVRRRRRVRPWGTLAVSGCAFLAPLQPVFLMPDGSPLRFAAADAVAPFVFLLTTLCLAATRCLDPGGGAAVLRALAAGGLWSAVIGLVAFAASMAGVETQLVAYGRLCSTMLGDPNIYCSLRLRERDGIQSLTMAHAARHLLGTARAPEQGRATACRQESMVCH